MFTSKTLVILVWGVSGLAACGSPSEGAGGELPAPYTLKCLKTACQACQDSTEDACSECYSLCSNPNAPSGCSSTCSSICNGTCPHCDGGTDTCQEWQATLPVPELDQAVYDACLETENSCTPDESYYDESHCNYTARVIKSQILGAYQCVSDHGCESTTHCFNWVDGPAQSTLGADFCERSSRCNRDCDHYERDFLNGVELQLRPSLASGVRHCINEKTCAEFSACADAFDTLWQIAWADPSKVESEIVAKSR